MENFEPMFGLGVKNEDYKQYFIGNSYVNLLVADEDVNVGIVNVTFEPKCRNDWHIHHEGYQILLVTDGEGWYQEEGKDAIKLKKGDTIVIKDGIKHWHGATNNSYFTHITITSGSVEWLEKVEDSYYNTL